MIPGIEALPCCLGISAGPQYINAWLLGNGAAAKLDDGRTVTLKLYEAPRDEEVAKIDRNSGRLDEAVRLMDELVAAQEFPTFLTLSAHEVLD